MKHSRENRSSDPNEAADISGERLAACIRERIARSDGALDFSAFMEYALYEPGLGYYAGGQRKFGAEGDFVTAPEIGDLFGKCLARQCAEVLEEISGANILEFGAGTGVLCAQILSALNETGDVPDCYYILELSPDLHERQRDTVAEICPGLLPRCRWLNCLPEDFRGIVIANEVLDAMPVKRFRVTVSGLEIVQVSWSDGGFYETSRPARDGELTDIVARGLPTGYESEVGVMAQHWVSEIGNWLKQGVVLVIDYGFPAHEFYHLERSRGTLMCHRRQKAHPDPYRHIGMQDITAHLDFSALARVADQAGLDVLGFVHQAAFLLSLGLLDLAKAAVDDSNRDYWARSQEVQRLTQSHEMGELFKVLALGRNYTGELTGFQYLDHRGRL